MHGRSLLAAKRVPVGVLWAASLGLGFAVVAAFTVAVARAPVDMPRCPPGLEPRATRCCPDGQTEREGACVGRALRCPPSFDAQGDACVAHPSRIRIPGGSSNWRPPDTLLGEGERASTGDFWIDRFETTWSQWRRCVSAGVCPEVKPSVGGDDGQAMSYVSRDEARTFCRWAGGHLIRDAEWLRAAIGDVELRYPWGDPDAFCLRAAFAMVSGPCARRAGGPDTAGARPWGATPLGVEDLAGNVAEWVDDDGAPTGAAVRGGSFRESESTALRARWRRVVDPAVRYDWIGFRCAYPEL